MSTRICCTCGRKLPLTKFHSNSARADGFCVKCKDCACIAARKWYADNIEIAKVRSHERYEKAADKYKARATKWRKKNPEKRKAIIAKSSAKHRDKKNAYAKRYRAQRRATNLAECREQYRRGAAVRRARMAKNGGFITKGWWDAMLSLTDCGRCFYCGKKTKKFVMDHFIPVKRGGKTEIGNLVPCCRPCNASKSAKMPQEWMLENCKDGAYDSIVWLLEIAKKAEAEWVADEQKVKANALHPDHMD